MGATQRKARATVLRIAAALARRDYTPSEGAEDWAKRPTAASVARVCEEHSERSRLAAIELSDAYRALCIEGGEDG